jgi:putative hemolysin
MLCRWPRLAGLEVRWEEVGDRGVSRVVWDIIIVLVIVSVGGFFASAEMALVSLREGQVRMLARRGKRGAKAAKLASDPNRFLSSVQIGMTLATLVSGAFGADTLSGVLRSWLVRQDMDGAVATPLAFAIVTVCITFVSLVLGELAPKRLALQRAVSLSLLAAPLLDRISLLARPIVWLLSVSVNMVVALLGGDPRKGRQAMTEQELRELVTGTQALSDDERHIVGEVFDAGKRQLREVLLPRTEVEFLAAGTTIGEAAKIAASVPYSRLPVFQGSYDNVIGFVHIRDLLGPGAMRVALVDQVVRPVKFLPISKTVLAALSEMRRERAHLAIVADEYGGTAGIVTLEDLVEELIGDIRDEYDIGESPATRLPRGEVDVDGLLNLDEFAEQTGIELPEGPYETVAGYVLAALGEVPSPGDSAGVPGFVITVTEMDGRRIARLRVSPARQVPVAGQPPGGQPPAGSAPPGGAAPPAPRPAADSQAPADSPLHGSGGPPVPPPQFHSGHPGLGRE